MPDPTPPKDWEELFVKAGHADFLDNALTLLKKSFPDGQYDKLDVRELMHKMAPRKNRNKKWVAGARVFHRPGAANDARICAFFFLRLKKQGVAVVYTLTAGASEQLDKFALYDALKAVCDFVAQSAGPTTGHDVERLELVSATQTPNPLHDNLKYAYTQAVTDGKLDPKGQVADSGPEWPRNLNSWEFKP